MNRLMKKGPFVEYLKNDIQLRNTNLDKAISKFEDKTQTLECWLKEVILVLNECVVDLSAFINKYKDEISVLNDRPAPKYKVGDEVYIREAWIHPMSGKIKREFTRGIIKKVHRNKKSVSYTIKFDVCHYRYGRLPEGMLYDQSSKGDI